ncbi:MAG: hydrolase [Verrucomicrobia bacterium]|nr:hydrolase [Verrucomicrobiota bacterium]
MSALSQRIRRTQAGLAVIDIQERLLPAIHQKERVVHNAVRLVRGAAILGLPTLVTEQYPKGLGPTVPEVAAALAPTIAPIEKLTFSACGAPGFTEALAAKGIADVLLCGIEAHVCVCQTCLELLEQDLRPVVVADAISSRAPDDCRVALERMRAAGAIVVSTEMVLFELLERAGTDAFRQILPLVK